MPSEERPARASRPVPRIPLFCLGSAAALTDGRPWSSLLLDRRILLDAPPTAITELHRHSLDVTSIDVVFISHLHADHVFGLPFLLLEYCLRYERERPLTLVGPPGLREAVDTLCRLAWPDMQAAGFDPHVPLVYVEAQQEEECVADDVQFRSVPMEHFGLAAFGYRLGYKDRTIAYSGDTGYGDALESLVRGADVAILELTHPAPRNDRGHLDVEQVARLAERLSTAGTRVFATHMSSIPPRMPGVTFCEPGESYLV